MKKTLFLAGMIFLAITVMAQKSWVGFSSEKAQLPDITVIDQNENQLIIDVSIKGMYVSEEAVSDQKFQRIELLPFRTTKDIGKPELPMLSEIIGIPGNKMVYVQVLEQESIKLDNYNIYPFQTPTTDNPGGHDKEFVMDKDFYAQAKDFPVRQVYVDGMGIWRDVKIANLHIVPFNYNPSSQELEVLTSIRLKITFSGNDDQFSFNGQKSVSPVFYNMYQAQIINFGSMGYSVNSKGNDDIRYLIITNDGAVPTLQPFIDWKNQQGYKVEVRTLESGFDSPQEFKTYISSLYTSDNLEYILMAGDAYPNGGSGGGDNIVPMFYWSPAGEDASYSDSWYTCMDGSDDHYADIAIGRITYDNLAELELQIQKNLDHYLAPDNNSNWAENSILIAHDQDYPAKYTACCEEIRTFPYSLQTPIFEQAYGGAGYTNSQVVNYVNNNSCGIFNYRGHGSATELWEWGPSGSFTAQHVNQLTNDDRLFVFFDVCCDNMDIVAHAGNCLCESFMKSDVAAVATNGAIIPSYTIPNHDYDKEMYKAVFEEGIYNIGYVTNFANVTVLDVHGEIGRSNVRTYLWLGDASIEPWTLQPADLSVSHDQQLFLGLSSFSVNVLGNGGPAENALVCVTNDDQSVYGVAFTDASGVAEIVFDEAVQTPGNVTVTVTVHNHLPYQAVIPVIPQEGPYVVKDSYSLNDAAGNNDGMMDYGESILLNLAVKNVGIEQAMNVNITLSTEDTYITFTDDSEIYGNIDPDQVLEMTDAFAFDVANNIPDGHFVLIDVEAIGDDDATWNSSFSIEGHAPLLEIGSMSIDDSEGGNGNGRLDPGEDANIIFETYNNGSSDALDALGTIDITNTYVTVNNLTFDLDVLGSGSMAEAEFSISISADAPIGTAISIVYNATSGEYSVQESFGASIGLILEDWETGDMSQYDWATGGTGNWAVVDNEAYEGIYSAQSSDIGDNQSNYVQLEYDVFSDDVISFWMKVSSESSYDYLRFYIDGNEQESWAGEVNWQQVEYNVSGGVHTFKWEYDKDGSVSNGSDCAWIDFIILPAPQIPAFFAGFTADATTVCEGGTVNFADASSGAATSWNWTFEGGSPDTSTEQNPTVTYDSEGDYNVNLEVSDGIETATTSITDYISVITAPDSPETPNGEAEVCTNYSLEYSYTVAGVANADSYEWSVLPTDAGTFTGNGTTGTIEWTEDYTGNVTIQVKAMNDCGDSDFSTAFDVMASICTGIADNIDENNLNIYPNPNSGSFTFELNGFYNEVTVEVFNALGKSVYKSDKIEVKGAFSQTIDLDTDAGVYYMHIEGENVMINKKVVVRK